MRLVSPTPPGDYDDMYASHMIFSGIIIELHVDHLVTSKLALVLSSMIMQLCCHNWEVKNFQLCK